MEEGWRQRDSMGGGRMQSDGRREKRVLKLERERR